MLSHASTALQQRTGGQKETRAPQARQESIRLDCGVQGRGGIQMGTSKIAASKPIHNVRSPPLLYAVALWRPCSPDAVLLADVVAAGAKALLPADGQLAGVHQVAKELPPSRHLRSARVSRRRQAGRPLLLLNARTRRGKRGVLGERAADRPTAYPENG
jgi:hypothetical protein